MSETDSPPLRILAVCNTQLGGNDTSYVDAFRRKGHSVLTVNPYHYFPKWQSRILRGIRKLLYTQIVASFNAAILETAEGFKPDLFFVFKGELIRPETLVSLKAKGIKCINFWPDVSFTAHGPWPAKTLPEFDWIFTSKSYGLLDLKTQLGVDHASVLLHAFDPQLHRPVQLDETSDDDPSCDVSFIGNWSPKKAAFLKALDAALPEIDLRIWGATLWKQATGLAHVYQGHTVTGLEYARAISASRINICILSEKRPGASSGDLSTARSFEIPGAGGFMLHERTDEAESLFKAGEECDFFDGPEELIEKVKLYLSAPSKRIAIAAAGHKRALDAGYSYDHRAQAIVDKYTELRGAQ